MKATSRIVPPLTALLAAAFLLTGCGEPTAAPGKDAPQGAPKIALVMKSLANQFFKTMQEGAEAHQAAHKAAHQDEYTLIANGTKDEQDMAAQINMVEQMINKRVDALVLAPADSQALVPVCKKALDAGIIVINIDNKFNAQALGEKNIKIPFVGPDNRKGARLAGECLAKKLKAGDAVAIVEGAPNAFNAVQRKLGFEDAINAAGLKVVSSQTGRWEVGEAEKVVAGMIREHPDLKGVLCANDSMALGAASAIQAAGRSGKVLVVGFDNISAVRPLLAKGQVVATADQHGDRLAVFGIEAALKILKGEAPPADQTTAVDLVTK